MKVTFLVACHNRRLLTVAALRTAFDSATAAGTSPHAVVFDDGSTDQTAAALFAEFGTRVTVIRGDGNAYWASSMAQAERAALTKPDISEDDLLVWLNDDVKLDHDGITKLIAAIEDGRGDVVVGSTRDPDTGELTYGGFRRVGPHPLSFQLVSPPESPEPIDAMNGNIVMLKVGAANRLGPIDGGFSHALADIDFATRAARMGEPVLLAPGTVGICARNPPARHSSVIAEWRAFLGPKGGGNAASLARILRRLAPLSWPVWWAATYAKWWFRQIAAAARC